MDHDCATCHLAESATWDDFEQKIRDEYAAFRRAGGQAFIGFWIPHTAEDQDGHRYVNCCGSVSFIVAYDRGETTLTFYDEIGEIETITIPWQDVTLGRLDKDFQMYVEQPWLESGEAYSVLIASRRVVQMLESLDEDPGNAWFATADWIKEYE